MPVVFQNRITRSDLIANPSVLYLFGDNDERTGYGGQAAEMRDEENAVGIRTKWAPRTDSSAYFNDRNYDEIIEMMENDFEPIINHLEEGKVVVIPLNGLGTGLSELPKRAPRIAAWLETQVMDLTNIDEG